MLVCGGKVIIEIWIEWLYGLTGSFLNIMSVGYKKQVGCKLKTRV